MDAKTVIMTQMAQVAERVQAGWDMLDRHRPGWHADVDMYRINMANCTECVLGQAFKRQWQDCEDAHQVVMRQWRASGQESERPEAAHLDNPYHYGLGQMIIASGVSIRTIGERDAFARKHGWLAGYDCSAEELSVGWTLAVRYAEFSGA